jgi:hypothetical protein
MEYPLIPWIARRKAGKAASSSKAHTWLVRKSVCRRWQQSPACAAPELFVIFIQVFS